ncbi:hypothetical protein UG55_103526 [Frankia sp. EI5c]|uniref:hypothetical protein n=1 Tax=Frankia sp. EI5c TaxID=683316 RepID=UPI0007C3FDB6|nr:hypothetical protein [Frankia sp. EI5c]OAA23592.1 hypothetical protein UG55_103526 [Frankia sp. EI5c]
MRRRVAATPPIPERLVRFAASEWPGDLAEAFDAWKAARRDFTARVPPGAYNPLGSALDRIRTERQTRRHWRVSAPTTRTPQCSDSDEGDLPR